MDSRKSNLSFDNRSNPIERDPIEDRYDFESTRSNSSSQRYQNRLKQNFLRKLLSKASVIGRTKSCDNLNVL